MFSTDQFAEFYVKRECLFCYFRFIDRLVRVFFFFFQAEDGIRDHCVTGVQTCALPIWHANIGSCEKNRDIQAVE